MRRALLPLMLLACDGDLAQAPSDAGVTPAADAEPPAADARPIDATCAPPALPRPAIDCPTGSPVDGLCPPAPPTFATWTCPPGWTPLGVLGLPEGVGHPSACAVEHDVACVWPRPDVTGGCRAPEDACVDALPAFEGRTHHVAPDGDGDGTADRPARLADALARAVDGDRIVLSAGDYAAPPEPVTAAVTLLGRCPGLPRLRGRLAIEGAGATVVGVHLVGGLDVAPTDAPVRLTGVLITGHDRAGLQVVGEGAHVLADDLAIGRPAAPPDGPAGGAALLDGAVMRVRGLTLRANHGFQLWAAGEGTRIEIGDAYIGDGIDGPRGGGRGVQIEAGAHATLERVFVPRAPNGGLGAFGEGTRLTVRDAMLGLDRLGVGAPGSAFVVGAGSGAAVTLERALIDQPIYIGVVATDRAQVEVRDTLVLRAGLSSDQSWPLVATDAGARLTIRRTAVLAHRGHGLAALDGAEVDAEDVLIGEGLPDIEHTRYAKGLTVLRGATARVRRLAVVQARVDAALVSGADAVLDAEDVQLRGTRPADLPAFPNGAGLTVDAGGRAVLRRARIEGMPYAGVAVIDGGAVDATDLAVVRAAGPPYRLAGAGVAIGSGASASLQRVRLTDLRLAGLVAAGDAEVSATDLWVKRVGPGPPLKGPPGPVDAQGFGVGAVEGARLVLRRARVTETTGAGLVVGDATALFEDLTVARTATRDCEPVDACGATGGIGLAAVGAATLTLRRAALNDNDLAGLHASADARVDLFDVTATGNAVGLSASDDAPPNLRCVRLEENALPTSSPRIDVPRLDDLTPGAPPGRDDGPGGD